jgi:23S rRNA-/tRNA-specific pseudouridylate synthase
MKAGRVRELAGPLGARRKMERHVQAEPSTRLDLATSGVVLGLLG